VGVGGLGCWKRVDGVERVEDRRRRSSQQAPAPAATAASSKHTTVQSMVAVQPHGVATHFRWRSRRSSVHSPRLVFFTSARSCGVEGGGRCGALVDWVTFG